MYPSLILTKHAFLPEGLILPASGSWTIYHTLILTNIIGLVLPTTFSSRIVKPAVSFAPQCYFFQIILLTGFPLVKSEDHQ